MRSSQRAYADQGNLARFWLVLLPPFRLRRRGGSGWGAFFRPNEVRPQPRTPPSLPPRCAQGEGLIGAHHMQPATCVCRSDGSRDGLRQCSPKIARIVSIVNSASMIQARAGFAPSLSPSAKGRVGVGCFSGRIEFCRGPAPLPTSPRAARKGRGGSARWQPASVGATEVAMVCGRTLRQPHSSFKSVRPLRGRFISFVGSRGARSAPERRSRPRRGERTARVKETNQRKGPSPTKRICQASVAGMFRLANPWLGRNTTHIHVRRPSGLCAGRGFVSGAIDGSRRAASDF